MKKSRRKISVFGMIGLLFLVLILIAGFFVLYRYLDHVGGQSASPSIEIFKPQPEEVLPAGQTYTIEALAKNRGKSVAVFQLYIDGFLAGSHNGPADSIPAEWGWMPTGSGNHELIFTATDTDGNLTTASVRVSVPGNYDRDGDGIADDQDACPDEPGSTLSTGCPSNEDVDMDGISDSSDSCPTEAGVLEMSGCPDIEVPDRDRDGALDDNDRCPDMPGLPEYAGCPASSWFADSDGDRVPDFLDSAPTDSGPVETGGSPLITTTDSDGDGVSDGEDACPDDPGPGSGCPLVDDSDGDGVPSGEDACPDVPGAGASDGCPPEEGLADGDGDGVPYFIDLDDSSFGFIGGLGLPLILDNDGDGVTNELDNCPEQAGPESNSGCPAAGLDYSALLASSTAFPELLDVCLLFPDTCDPDGDGVMGTADLCPREAGQPSNGCPIPSSPVIPGYPGDRDMDGVLDEVDDCPDQPGDPVNGGCPDPQDTDRDGVETAYDECPDIPGPVTNSGCPRAGDPLTVELKIVSLITDPGWDYGVYCYALTTGMEGHVRVPEARMLNVGIDGVVDLGSRDRIDITTQEDGITIIKLSCWGQRSIIGEYSQHLGSIDRSPRMDQWDSQLRTVRGEGSGGWFELTYRLCQGFCP